MTKGKPPKDGKQCPGSLWDVFVQREEHTQAQKEIYTMEWEEHKALYINYKKDIR